MSNTVIAVVQARLGSVRLPEKVMLEIEGEPLIGLLLARLSESTQLSAIVVALPDSAENDPLANYVASLGYPIVRGDEYDVLARYAKALDETQADVIVRITGDCPLVDPATATAGPARSRARRASSSTANGFRGSGERKVRK